MRRRNSLESNEYKEPGCNKDEEELDSAVEEEDLDNIVKGKELGGVKGKDPGWYR